MKSWADMSSDEESDYETEKIPNNEPPRHPPMMDAIPDDDDADEGENQEEQVQKEQPKKQKEYEFPDTPPFTAYIGNLTFSIQEGEELGQKIAELVKVRFSKDIKVVRARVTVDRREKKPRGFGYVEVESIEDLKSVLELNDGKSILAGRPIHLDVAQPHAAGIDGKRYNRGFHQSKSFSEVDGSSFRGGRYNKQRSQSFRRQNSSSSDAGQRPSLKLHPRSKNRDDSDNVSGGSSIFGDGKARDGDGWVSRRSSTTSNDKANNNGSSSSNISNNHNNNNNNQNSNRNNPKTHDEPRRPSRNSMNRNQSGGGGGSSGGGKGRGNRNSYRRQNSTPGRGGAQNQKKEEAKKPEPPKKSEPPPTPTTKANAATKKVANKFAALDFGDSDSD